MDAEIKVFSAEAPELSKVRSFNPRERQRRSEKVREGQRRAEKVRVYFSLERVRYYIYLCASYLTLSSDSNQSPADRDNAFGKRQLRSEVLFSQCRQQTDDQPVSGQKRILKATEANRRNRAARTRPKGNSSRTAPASLFFLAYFYPSDPFICIFSKTSPDFFLCWLWLIHGSCVGRRIT